MARRRGPTAQETAARARQALDEVSRAADPEETARRVLEQAGSVPLRQAIVEASLGAPHRVTAALVRAALQRDEPPLARTSADLLVDLAHGPSGLELTELCLQSPDVAVRERAIEALEGLSDPGALKLLARALMDRDQAVRRAASGSLSLIAGTAYHRLREPLLAALGDPESELARAIVANPDEQVRLQAAQGLSFAASERVLPTVRALAADSSDEVRQEAVMCLASVGTEAAVELMGACLDDPSYRVAASVLDMLSAALGGASSRLVRYLEHAMRHPDPDVRRHAVLMLDRFEFDQVRPLLERATRDADLEVARRASEVLQRHAGASGVEWLADEISQGTGGAIPLWEAGSIGMEKDLRGDRDAARDLREVTEALEQALATGSSSNKVHALNELASLIDISDSDAMQAALYDEDSSVRSRAADTLSYTRDAGLLVKVLESHPDAMVRRRAIEALRENPGGPVRRGAALRRIVFAEEQTVGTQLFGRFLKALRDPDEGVRQAACEAIRSYAQRLRLLPVRATLAELERLAAREDVSFFSQEDAERTAELVRKGTLAGLIVEHGTQALAWRGELLRRAQALRWDGGRNAWLLDGAVGAEAIAEWGKESGLSEAELVAVQAAASSGEPLEAPLAERLRRDLMRDLAAAVMALARAAHAVALIGQEGFGRSLREWAEAMHTEAELQWPPAPRLTTLGRLRRLAWMQAMLALALAEGRSPAGAIEDALNDRDDWVKIEALAALAEADPDQSDIERLLALCRAHAAEREYHRPVGLAAAVLLGRGMAEAAAMAEAAVAAAPVELRMELTHRLLLAAQRPEGARALKEHIGDSSPGAVPSLCLALALRGAGHDVRAPEACPEDEPETLCACLALRSMQGDAEAAERLEDMLRAGPAGQRYVSAHYLSLARVRSAVLLFASVVDQQAPYALRGLCAGSLIRRGHSAGPAWFRKTLPSVAGSVHARLLVHLSRAVEDTVPLMLECADVNLGRFV